MEVKILDTYGTWRQVADAARTTVGKEAGEGEPSSTWKRRILLAEHSPIRLLSFRWRWTDMPWWVQTHFTRHKFGVEWFVSTSREDRTGVPRQGKAQDAPVNVEGLANAQAIINISRKRLCSMAAPETRLAWMMLLRELKQWEPELAAVCVPECVYRGHCYEFRGCGYGQTNTFFREWQKYRGEEILSADK